MPVSVVVVVRVANGQVSKYGSHYYAYNLVNESIVKTERAQSVGRRQRSVQAARRFG
jgi:hypothetical protein